MKNKIVFSTINELKSFCKKGKIYPEVEINSKKHSNMRGEFKHQITGSFQCNLSKFIFKVKEELILKERQFFIDFSKL